MWGVTFQGTMCLSEITCIWNTSEKACKHPVLPPPLPTPYSAPLCDAFGSLPDLAWSHTYLTHLKWSVPACTVHQIYARPVETNQIHVDTMISRNTSFAGEKKGKPTTTDWSPASTLEHNWQWWNQGWEWWNEREETDGSISKIKEYLWQEAQCRCNCSSL